MSVKAVIFATPNKSRDNGMKNAFEVVDHEKNLVWAFSMRPTTNEWWEVATTNLGGLLFAIPDFIDKTQPLLMNTIERWCIINGLTIRPELTLTKEKYDIYHINGEPVFISFRWAVSAKYKRRKSGNSRIEHFEVCSEDRAGANDLLHRKFKGASLVEVKSITPTGYGICYWKNRPGFPHIDPDTLSRLKMPENL